jgi:hypothetical protein
MPNICNFENCRKRAYYGYTYGSFERCKEHKEGRPTAIMICKCGKSLPYFNEPGEKTPICCASCKTETMVNLKVKKCKCGKSQPHYNEPGEKTPICCASCKTETMINIKNKKCKLENCPILANPKYKGYCANCFTHLFPNDPLTFQTRCKTKELAVRDYINMNFEGFICDRQLTTANCDCTIRRRPDLRIHINETLLVIEVDENQHKSYSEMDEETRYNDLYMAYSGKWIYIRFNPDKFKKNNKNVNPTIAKRLPKLKEEIEKQFRRIENNENKELVERIYLYFDK